MVVSRGAPVCRCDMASCLDARPSTRRPDFPQWPTSSSCFEPSALMVHRSHSADLWVDASFTVTVQSARFPPPRWHYTFRNKSCHTSDWDPSWSEVFECSRGTRIHPSIHPCWGQWDSLYMTVIVSGLSDGALFNDTISLYHQLFIFIAFYLFSSLYFPMIHYVCISYALAGL